MAVAFTACQDLDDPIPLAPEISTPDVLAVGDHFALFDSIHVDDESVINAYYYVSTTNDMSDADIAWENDTLWGLTHSTTYYYAACVTNGTSEVYGETKTFTTEIVYELSVDDETDIDEWNEGGESSDSTAFDLTETETETEVNGYTAVDLGLSVLWASCNVGAEDIDDAGYYYAWGETSTKSSYTSSNSVTYGVDVDDFSGDATYDAARAVMGGTWRIPTLDEMDELISECEWSYVYVNSTYGYKVTGDNGNYIFLPIRGYYSNSSLTSSTSHGAYWTSTPCSSTNYAYNLAMNSSYHRTESANRAHGHLIRAVTN